MSRTCSTPNLPLIAQKCPIDGKTQRIGDIWSDAPSYARKNLETFWSFLGRKYSEFIISHEEVRQALINLGLRNPRGPKIKNEGVQVKTQFAPHAIWEGDGKEVVITMNGEIFKYCWYAFIDQDTTLLVGSSIERAESPAGFLKALKDGKNNADFYAVGVLVDNRIPESDIGPVKSFCEEHGIVIIRTFPGNSKSNGNIESNFGIFDRFVGQVHIEGENPQEIAESMAKNIVEIFTQQRNHQPRKRNGGRTPIEAASESVRPIEVRDELEKLKYRFEKEQIDIEKKFKLIAEIYNDMGEMTEKDLEKFKKQLKSYPYEDILAAVAAYKAQRDKYPLNNYKAGYFMAILRNKREESAKRVYSEAFRSGVEIILTSPPKYLNPEESALKFVEILKECFDISTPSVRMLHMETLCWWMVDYSTRESLPQLWKTVEKQLQSSVDITTKNLSEVTEYFYSKLGALLYSDDSEKMPLVNKEKSENIPLSH
jgi:transposase InsO family protein